MKSEQELPEYLTLQEVSRMLKVHPNTLRVWDKNGALQAVRIGVKRIRRYRKSDVDDFIRKSSN
ncbi:helix-turn-helix domain-containing protein [Candidatus Nanosynbacter sp. TM7-087]|uniref:helix-turn-helix domain-containing protein n=1 Tax=Candidatus Nanosynbacter sp. TM7-087 TaxID=2902631 RepID=UPI001FB60323|nr:helix-turn-helix domain-containing protein [Candidatus Nanosynbacter sp. TM7-087]MCJ1966641.1 helix-turn-helix domain-containing protein [Candidatus Nanosynbacter sp. TM7-087]